MKMQKTLAALAAAGALIVAGCGDDKTSSTAGNGTDRAFVADMIPHHRSAVGMAKIAQARGRSPFVKTLASSIVRTQTKEITQLRIQDKELADAGVKRGSLGAAHGMGMGGDIGSLKMASPFDPAFLRMMLPHHSGAVEMAKIELAKGEDPELKKLAQQIIDAQQREIGEMRRQL